MTKQMTYLSQTDDVLGWLTFWTLTQGEYDLQTISQVAHDRDVPQYIQDRLSGRDLISAFKAATQLGASGKIISPCGNILRRLVSRDALVDSDNVRAIVLETTKTTWDTAEWVSSKTVCLVSIKGSRAEIDWSDWVDSDPASFEIKRVVEDMESRMYQIEGKVDDGRIRSAVLSWLEKNHRVTVRGSGGVYFLPYSPSYRNRDEMEHDLTAVRDWLQDALSSPLSIIAIHNDGVNSLDSFREDAISEVKGMVDEISGKLVKWEQNTNMNAGSKNYSAGTQLDKVSEIQEKVETLKVSLGEQLGVCDEMISIVKVRLEQMVKDTARQIDTDKSARNARRREKRQAKADQAKKSGTAKSRNRKRKI